jgi:iron complex outermembrane receptor protein
MDVTLPDGFRTTSVQTPELNVNGLLRYAYPVWKGELAWQADFEYQSKKYFSTTKASSIKEGGYVVGNVRVSYTTEDRVWETAFFVHNVADEEYVVAGFDVSGDFGWTEHYYGRPRWIGGSVRYSWD